jgi:hypothetical protein
MTEEHPQFPEDERAALHERAATLERILGNNKRCITQTQDHLDEMKLEYRDGCRQLSDIKKLLRLSKPRKPKPGRPAGAKDKVPRKRKVALLSKRAGLEEIKAKAQAEATCRSCNELLAECVCGADIVLPQPNIVDKGS